MSRLKKLIFGEKVKWSLWGFDIKDLKWKPIWSNQPSKAALMELFVKEFHRVHGKFDQWNKFVISKDITHCEPQMELHVETKISEETLPENFNLPADQLEYTPAALSDTANADLRELWKHMQAQAKQTQKAAWPQQLGGVNGQLIGGAGANPYLPSPNYPNTFGTGQNNKVDSDSV